MSLVSSSGVHCAPAKPRRRPADVPGTANISYGRRLRERENCRAVKHPDVRASIRQGSLEDKSELERFLRAWEFEKQTNRKIRKKNARLRVQQGMAAYEDSLNARREKLRELITSEEIAHIREVVEQAQRGDDTRLQEHLEETEERKKHEEEQRLAIVAAKRMQQYLARCPEVRERLSRESTLEAKHCNLVQMAENAAKRQSERELDELWHELMLKELEAKRRGELEESEKRAAIDQRVTDTLASQIAEKLALEEEKKRSERAEREELELLWEKVRAEEARILEREKRKREVLRAELEEQILAAKRGLAERAREETELERKRGELAEEELAREKAAIRDSMVALRKELLAYLSYVEELREEEARRNLEYDRVVEESRRDLQSRRDLAIRKFREARERELREVLRGREEQLREKERERERERRERDEEREVLLREIELLDKLTAGEREDARRKALEYGRDLKEQQRYAEEMRRREKEKEERILREGLRKEEEYQRLTEELLKASENVTPHPFKILLKECAARRDAEKRGLCYCPPPPE